MKGIDFKKQLATNTANTLKNNKLISSESIKNNLIILPELRDFIPPLNVGELNSLEDSIIANGCRTPLLVWDTTHSVINSANQTPHDTAFVLIDGHHRYQICKKNGVDFQIDLMSFPSIEEVKDFMIDFQVGRRNMTLEQLSYLRGLKYQRLKLKQGGIRTGKGIEEITIMDTAAKLADEFKVSKATIKRDAIFAEGLDKMEIDLKTKILNGQTKIDKKSIQQLAKSEIENAISSIEQLQKVINFNKDVQENEITSIYKNENFRENLVKQVKNGLKNATNSDITVDIKGTFIINNGLEETWRKLRGFSDDVVIDENFTDKISFFQTLSLGIVQN